MKTEIHKMQTLVFDISSLMPMRGEQGADTVAPELGLDFSTLMSDSAPPTARASQPRTPTALTMIPSEEDSRHSAESEEEEVDEGEDKGGSWSSEDDDP